MGFDELRSRFIAAWAQRLKLRGLRSAIIVRLSCRHYLSIFWETLEDNKSVGPSSGGRFVIHVLVLLKVNLVGIVREAGEQEIRIASRLAKQLLLVLSSSYRADLAARTPDRFLSGEIFHLGGLAPDVVEVVLRDPARCAMMPFTSGSGTS